MSDRINNKYKESLLKQRSIEHMKVKDMYNLVFNYNKEGNTGRIRFPKWLRDLHRKITKDYDSSELIITSQLIDILNHKSLEYCDKKILSINSQSVHNTNSEDKR